MSGYLVRSAHPRARGFAPGAVRQRPADGAATAAATRWEAALFEGYRDRRVPLEIVCFDGIVIHGYLRAWERYSLLVDTEDGEILLMKHGVIRMGARRTRSGGGPEAVTVRRSVRAVERTDPA
jgi:sRNA-binding regulator protein Hfq